MSFRFSCIITRLSNRFTKKNDTQTIKKKKKKTKKSTTAATTIPTTQDVEEPMSISSSSSHHTNNNDLPENNVIVLAGVAAAAVSAQELPYAQYVTLSSEEKKFHCQKRVMAHEVKYTMVMTVVNSWEQDLKTIPEWDKIDRKSTRLNSSHVD